jgi:hypothetical protein
LPAPSGNAPLNWRKPPEPDLDSNNSTLRSELMKQLRPTLLAAALMLAWPAFAQSNADVLKEINALKAKVAELEAKVRAQEEAEKQKAAAGASAEQQREINRIGVKTEALEDSRDAQGMKNLKISGYMDPTFIVNQRQDRAGFQFLSSIANDAYSYDSSYFGGAVIDFQKETDSGSRYRLTLMPNRGTDSVIGNGGIVQEASVSIPLTSLQTRLIAGHVPDWSGYEFLPATQNKLITHNLLFDFTLPTSYTGVGLDITDSKWIYKAMIANLNASRRTSGNKAPVLAYRVDYARGEFQGFGFAGVHGKAANFADATGKDSTLNAFEIDGYFVRGDVTVQGQLSFGKHKGAAVTPDPDTGALRDASWTGLSVLGAYKFNPRFEGIARLDHIRNRKNGGGLLGFAASDSRNGIGPGILELDANGDPVFIDAERGASRSALSLGLSYLFDLNTTFKFEYRLDRADQPVFLNVKDGSFKKSNSLLGTSVLVSF